jgi:drug/metabolite transporter (DMT)-like permease
VGLLGIPPFTGAAARFLVASVVLLAVAPLFGVRLRQLARRRSERRFWAFNTLFSFVIPYTTVYWSQQWLPSGLGAVLFATFPLFVALLAHWVLPEERLGPGGVAGMVVGFGGVAVLFSEDLTHFGGTIGVVAAGVALLGAAGSAVAEVVIKGRGKGLHPVSLTAVPMGLTALVMAGLAGLLERDAPITVTATNTGAILYLALFGSAVSFGLYFWLLSHIPATRLALMAYLIPLIATAVGVTFLDETVTGRLLLGGALILGGVWLATRTR